MHIQCGPSGETIWGFSAPSPSEPASYKGNKARLNPQQLPALSPQGCVLRVPPNRSLASPPQLSPGCLGAETISSSALIGSPGASRPYRRLPLRAPVVQSAGHMLIYSLPRPPCADGCAAV